MARKEVKKAPDRTEDGYVYLTKRMLVRKAAIAGNAASRRAMDIMGYVVTTEGQWVVRKNKDGSVERITPVESSIP